MGAMLLVVWFNAGGGPGVAYSAQFTSMPACAAAQQALQQEQVRLAKSNPMGPQFGPVVSAVCVPK